MTDGTEAQVGSSPASVPPKPWDKYGRWGSIFRSRDFKYSVPIAIGLGALPAFDTNVAQGTVPILIAFGGALVALASVVIVAITLFVALISPEYLALMQRVHGGLKGAVRPYYIVVFICMTGAITSFAAALAWPSVPQHDAWFKWLLFALPALLMSWGLLGGIQLVALGNFHIEQRARLMEVVRDIRKKECK
jgi:hypothetical protein